MVPPAAPAVGSGTAPPATGGAAATSPADMAAVEQLDAPSGADAERSGGQGGQPNVPTGGSAVPPAVLQRRVQPARAARAVAADRAFALTVADAVVVDAITGLGDAADVSDGTADEPGGEPGAGSAAGAEAANSA